jgi:hypothetical protein
MTDITVDTIEAKNGILDMNKNQELNVENEDDLKSKLIFYIDRPPWHIRCFCCLRHIDELDAFGGPGDPLVGDFTGAKLVRIYRSLCRHNEEFERINDEAKKKYLADGFENGNDWIVAKYGEEKASEIMMYDEVVGYISKNFECRDCIVLDDNDYHDKTERCHAEWVKANEN